MARRHTKQEAPPDPANEWLQTHTLQDIRELAQELSDNGEDVADLVQAVNELEQLLADANVQNPAETSEA